MLPDAMSTTFLVDLPMAPTGPVTQRSPHVFWPISYCKHFGFSFINPLHILRGLTGSSACLWKELILVGAPVPAGLEQKQGQDPSVCGGRGVHPCCVRLCELNVRF